jgi:hypothetical protein
MKTLSNDDRRRQLQCEIGSKAQQTEVKVERKLIKEARIRYQSFRIGQAKIRDLDRKKLIDFKNFEQNKA